MKEGPQTVGELLMSLVAIGVGAMLVSWKHERNADRQNKKKFSGRNNTDGTVLKIQSKDAGMHYVHLGRPQSEEECFLIFTKKTSVSSWKEFLTKASDFADSKDDGCEWTEKYPDLNCIPVECSNSMRLPDLKRWSQDNGYEKETVTVVIEPIISCMDLGLQEWNVRTKMIETETDYIFYSWHTTA